MATKHEVLRAHLKEWLACKGDKEKRGALGRRLAQSLRMNKKSISRSMRRLQRTSASDPEHRGRPEKYGSDVTAALAEIWEAMEYPCAENMTRLLIDEYLSHFMTEGWSYSDTITGSLLAMSTATKKRRIASFRKKRGLLRGRSATHASPLKGMIPIRKSHEWLGLPPGHLQTDSVVHCGDLLTGDVLYSVGCVDFATYWSEYTAQWNKGEVATRESLETVRERFPFCILELHPDTGTEFINYHVHTWAVEEGIELTRSAPYKKNDNMCIEERNNSIARKHLGYARIDDPSLVPLAAEILRLACLLHNHFRPVRRMTSKVRMGANWKRTFEKEAKTPYHRALDQKNIPETAKQRLRKEHAALNPLEIKRRLDMLKKELQEKLRRLSDQKSAGR